MRRPGPETRCDSTSPPRPRNYSSITGGTPVGGGSAHMRAVSHNTSTTARAARPVYFRCLASAVVNRPNDEHAGATRRPSVPAPSAKPCGPVQGPKGPREVRCTRANGLRTRGARSSRPGSVRTRRPGCGCRGRRRPRCGRAAWPRIHVGSSTCPPTSTSRRPGPVPHARAPQWRR